MGAKLCDRITICESIIDHISSADTGRVIIFSDSVEYDSRSQNNHQLLKEAVQKIDDDGGTAYLDTALDYACSFIDGNSSDLYRIVVITSSAVNFGRISADDFSSNTALNIVNLGSSAIGRNIDAVAQATGGDVYNAITADDLTSQHGETIYTPPQFIGVDSDGDTIPDIVEECGLKPNGEPIGTNPNLKDSDGDGIEDQIELGYMNINQIVNRPEQYLEFITYISDPAKVDTDGDAFPDNYLKSMQGQGFYEYTDPNPLTSDVIEIVLKNDFFSVDYKKMPGATYEWKNTDENKYESCGGAQAWFGSYGYTETMKIFCNDSVTGAKMADDGCGIVTAADWFMYMAIGDEKYNPTSGEKNLGDEYEHIDFEFYIEYVECISDYYKLGWGGMLITDFVNGLKEISDGNDMNLKFNIDYSVVHKDKALNDIKRMISEGISAPMLYSNPFVKLKLCEFNDMIYNYSGPSIDGHFMNATGVIEYSEDVADFVDHTCMIKLATFGREYYIDYDEYTAIKGNLSSVVNIERGD